MTGRAANVVLVHRGPREWFTGAVYVDAVAAEAKEKGDARVHRLHMPALAQNTDLGCDYHPNVSGHKKYADALIPEAQRLLGATGVRSPPARRQGMRGNPAPSWRRIW